jgi:hypothetical protein
MDSFKQWKHEVVGYHLLADTPLFSRRSSAIHMYYLQLFVSIFE